MNALPYLILGLGLFWALLLWARSTEQGRVHTELFERLLKVGREFGIPNLRIVSGPNMPKGMVYLVDIDAFKFPPSPHEQGDAVDLVVSRKWFEENADKDAAHWLYEYSLHFHMRRGAAHTNAIIRNITDSEV